MTDKSKKHTIEMLNKHKDVEVLVYDGKAYVDTRAFAHCVFDNTSYYSTKMLDMCKHDSIKQGDRQFASLEATSSAHDEVRAGQKSVGERGERFLQAGGMQAFLKNVHALLGDSNENAEAAKPDISQLHELQIRNEKLQRLLDNAEQEVQDLEAALSAELGNSDHAAEQMQHAQNKAAQALAEKEQAALELANVIEAYEEQIKAIKAQNSASKHKQSLLRSFMTSSETAMWGQLLVAIAAAIVTTISLASCLHFEQLQSLGLAGTVIQFLAAAFIGIVVEVAVVSFSIRGMQKHVGIIAVFQLALIGYETGVWQALQDLDWSTAQWVGGIAATVIVPATQFLLADIVHEE